MKWPNSRCISKHLRRAALVAVITAGSSAIADAQSSTQITVPNIRSNHFVDPTKQKIVNVRTANQANNQASGGVQRIGTTVASGSSVVTHAGYDPTARGGEIIAQVGHATPQPLNAEAPRVAKVRVPVKAPTSNFVKPDPKAFRGNSAPVTVSTKPKVQPAGFVESEEDEEEGFSFSISDDSISMPKQLNPKAVPPLQKHIPAGSAPKVNSFAAPKKLELPKSSGTLTPEPKPPVATEVDLPQREGNVKAPSVERIETPLAKPADPPATEPGGRSPIVKRAETPSEAPSVSGPSETRPLVKRTEKPAPAPMDSPIVEVPARTIIKPLETPPSLVKAGPGRIIDVKTPANLNPGESKGTAQWKTPLIVGGSKSGKTLTADAKKTTVIVPLPNSLADGSAKKPKVEKPGDSQGPELNPSQLTKSAESKTVPIGSALQQPVQITPPKLVASAEYELTVAESKALYQSNPVVRVSVEHPEICEALTTATDTIVLIGRTTGKTRVAVWTKTTPNLQPIVYDIDVSEKNQLLKTQDTASALMEAINKKFGDCKIKVGKSQAGYIVAGSVQSEYEAKQIMHFVRSICLEAIVDRIVVR